MTIFSHFWKHFPGECFSGPQEDRYNEDGQAKEDMCIDEDQNVCLSNSTKACAGIGKKDPVSKKFKYANYVFMIVTDTHKEINVIQ